MSINTVISVYCSCLLRHYLLKCSPLQLQLLNRMKSIFKPFILSLILWGCVVENYAEPWLKAGDTLLRHDVTILSDAGVIQSPITTWPIPVASIDFDLDNFENYSGLSDSEKISFDRLQRRLAREKRTYQTEPEYGFTVSREDALIRGYQNTARSDLQLNAGLSKLTDRFAFRIETQLVDNASDKKNVRFDGSYAAGVFGNTIVSAGYIDRWWGPGWQGSLIFSNNARPIPGISLQRNFTKPFANRWFSWMGPWNYSITAGQLEGNRVVPDAFHLGMRLAFKPKSNLEFGLSRTAQWGGEGRPQTSDSFLDLLLGQDNIGSNGLTRENEPGNQMAGFDARWKQKLIPFDLALYVQGIGEDEAGGFPSRYLGLFGLEHSRSVYDKNVRIWLEYADTACDFLESKPKLNCAYQNGIYQSGYRYLGESIGHPIDGDGRQLSLSAVISDASSVDWQLQLHKLNLNRAPDTFHSKTNVPANGFQFDLARTAESSWGKVRVNLGYQNFDAPLKSENGLLVGIEFRRQISY